VKRPAQVPRIASVDPGAAWLIFVCRFAFAQLTWTTALLPAAGATRASNAIPATILVRIDG